MGHPSRSTSSHIWRCMARNLTRRGNKSRICSAMPPHTAWTEQSQEAAIMGARTPHPTCTSTATSTTGWDTTHPLSVTSR
jgi:hypothetical protein